MANSKKTKNCPKSKPVNGSNFSFEKIIQSAREIVFNVQKHFTELVNREVNIFSKSSFPISFKPFLVLQGVVISAFILFFIFSFGNIFIAQPKIADSQIIKNVSVKQVSKIVAGQPVKWVAFVNRDQIKAGQNLIQLPKGAYNVKITTVTSEKAKQILAQKPTDDFSLEQRQQLASAGYAKKQNFIAKISGFLFASLEEAATQIIETVTAPESEVVQTSEATYVDLSAETAEAPPAAEETAPTTQEPQVETPEATTTTETAEITEETPAEETTTEQAETAAEEAPTETPTETEVTTPEETTPATETTEVPAETVLPSEPAVAPTSETASVLETTSPTEQEIVARSDLATTQEEEVTEAVNDVVQVTYETPAPVTTEQETDMGKLVTVVSEDEDLTAPLVDVIASTKIPEIYKVGQEDRIKIKWKNNGNLEVAFHAYDTDNNGKLDYVEWTVPHLSEQIFEIIFISKAFELDENQEIISDIYDQVQAKDDTWATVPNSHYVRSTFGQVLDNTKDITIYAKPTVTSDVARIEVYPVYTDADGNATQGSLVATFENIDQEDTYKILLTNLSTPTDVFDLKIIATSDVAIDWIVDPTPTNAYWVGGAGNWSDATNHWATSSNGTPDAGNLPGTTTNVYFDSSSGTGTVTVDGNISIASFTHSQTSLTVDIGTYDFTVSGASSVTNGTVTIGAGTNGWTTAGMTIGTGGTVTCSGASKITDSGNWNSVNGSFTRSTSTVTMTAESADATLSTKTNYVAVFHDLVINSVSHKVTWDTNSAGYVYIDGSLSITGELDINNGHAVLYYSGDVNVPLTINTSSILGGTGTLTKVNNYGYADIANNGTISITNFEYQGAGPVTATTYGGNLLINPSSAGSTTFTISSGTLNVTGTLKINTIGSAGYTYTLSNSNNATIIVGGLTVGTSGTTTRYGKFIAANSSSGTPSVTVNGNVAINASDASGTNEIDAYGSLWTVTGNWTNSDTFVAGSSTVTFTGTGASGTITSGGSSFYNLTQNGTGGTYTLQDALVVSHTLTIAAGTMDTKSGSSYAVTVGSADPVNGDFVQSSTTSKFLANSSTITLNGNGTFTADGTMASTQYNSATLVLNGTNTLTYNNMSGGAFNNLTCGQSGNTTTIATGFTVVSTVTIGSGTLSSSTWMYVLGSTPFSFDAASHLTIGTLYLSNTNSLLPYLANGYNCGIVVNSNKSVTQDGNITITGQLLIYGGSYADTTATWKTNGYNLTVNSNIQIGVGNDTGLKKLDATNYTNPDANAKSTITLSGNWKNYGTGTAPSQFIAANSTVIFSATSTGKTITSGTTNSPFYNVEFNGTGGGWTLQDNLTATTLTSTLGRLTDNGKTVTVNGNILIANTTGLMTSTGTWVQGASGNISNPKDGNSFYVLQIPASVTSTLTANIQAKKVILGNNATLTGGTTYEVVLMYPSGNDFIDIASTATLTGSYIAIYPSIFLTQKAWNTASRVRIVYGSNIVRMTGDWTVGGLWIHGGCCNGSAEAYALTLDTGDGTNNYNLTVNGYVQLGLSSPTYPEGYRGKLVLRTGNHTITSYIDVQGGSSYSWGYLNLSASNVNLSVGGNIDLTRATLTPGTSSTVTLTGTSASGTITSAGNSFYNLIQNGSGGTYTLQDAMAVAGNLTVSAGTLAVGAKDLTVTGSSTVTGGTVTMSAPTATGWTTAGMTIGTGGTVTMSGAAKIYNSGNWDSSVGTFTSPDTIGCRLTMTGAGTTFKNKTANMGELMIADGASVTLLSNITTLQRMYLNGSLSIGSYTASVLGGLTQGANGSINGSGMVNFISYHIASVDFANPSALNPGTLKFDTYFSLPTGTYSPTTSLIIWSSGSSTNTFTWKTGDYTFTSPVIFQHTTNSGTIAISCVNNPNLTFEKDVTVTETVGTVTWTKGNGTITLTGGDANINFLGESVEDMVVNGSGVKTLTDNVTTDSLTVSAGTLNTGGKNITTTGNFTVADGGLVTASGLAGSTLTVGGNFSASGHSGALLTLDPSATWYLNVTGTASASYVNAAYSDASGGTAVTPTNSTDSGHNVNWLFNTAPVFASLSDGSSATNPTNAAGNVNFTATANDTEANQYYLAICKTDSITAVNGGAPNCATDQTWCVSGATDSGSQASCSYATSAASAESNDWYAFVCDTASVSLCSASSQGTGDNGSPFKVNHMPAFTALSTSPDLAGLGSSITFTATASDADTDTLADTVALYVCKSNDFTGSACGSAGEWCHSSAAASNPSCSYTITSSDTSGSKNYYGYIIDSHNFQASENPKTSTFTSDIDAPVISNISPAIGSIAVLPSSVSFTLNEVGYCRISGTNQAYSLMTSDCQGGGTTSITCAVSSNDQQSIAAYVACQDVLGNQNTSANSTRVSYGLPGGTSGGGAVSFNPIATTVQTVQEAVQQTTQTVVETVQNIPQQIAEAPKAVVETVQNVTTNIANVVTTLLPEKQEQQIAYPPIEESVPEETPLVFKKTEDLISTSSLGNFVFAPLPESVQSLVSKFPELESTFSQVGISKMKDLQELTTTSFNLPTLNGILPQLSQGVALSKISEAEKAEVPTSIVFASMAEEKIGLNVKISITAQGEPVQTISTIQNQVVTLSVKPEHEAETVKGYVIFKGKNTPVATAEGLSGNLLTAGLGASAIASTVTAETVQTAKTEFVLDTFDYTDLDGDGIYTANIVAPAVDANYEIRTIIDYKNSKLASEELSMIMLVDPEGYIYRKISDSEESRIKGAKVSLYWLNPETEKYELWPAENYQQDNPQTTDATGKYSFLVPEGYYYIKVEHMLYADVQTEPFEVKQGAGIHTNIELKSKNWLLSIFSPGALLIVVALLVLATAIVVAAILVSTSLKHKNIEQENLKNNKLKK